MIDRLFITILLVGAIVRPVDVSFLFGFLIIVFWLCWESMLFIVMKWKRSESEIECLKRFET